MRHARFGHWGVCAAALLAAIVAADRPALAGPGTYDSKTREFTLTYTYARLPGIGVVGEPVRPSDQMDATVRSFIAQVGEYLKVVTDGRGKLANPQLVDSAARADVVISPDNPSDRVAYATPGGFGKQGGVYIYYRVLADQSRSSREGVTLTVVHELCHYLFDLPDEYPDSGDGAPSRHCPADPSGQGCLMDNYWSRPWYQRPCADDHNTTVASRTQNRRYPDSCKSKIDAFFAQRGVVGGQPADQAGGMSGSQPAVTEADRLQTIITSVIVQVRKDVHKVDLRTLRDFAASQVRASLKGQNLTRTDAEIGKAVDAIMKAVAIAAMPPPARFAAVAALLRAEAIRLAKASLAKDDASKIADVNSELIKAAIAKAPPATGNGYTAADLEYLESVARSAVLAPAADQGAAKNKDDVFFQMLRYLFEAVRDLSAETNPAVAGVMSDHLRDLDQTGRQFGLAVPVRPRFGTRRTMIIAPKPRKDAFDLVPLQSGVFSYTAMRDLYLKQFARLIQRNSIEYSAFNKIDLRQRIETNVDDRFGVEGSAASKDVREPSAAPGEGGMRPSPQGSLAELLNAILDDIRKDQLENIAVLIPPGGLDEQPNELDGFLRTFREEKLVRRSDIRLDVVVVGPQAVPPLLMDLVERSGGVVLTINDIHETGAIAQRLKNEQSAGAWITVPRQFDLFCGGMDPKDSSAEADQKAATDLLTPRKLEEYDLGLMPWGDGSRVPATGRLLVIAGTDDRGQLHIRIFDATENSFTDTDETKLPPTQAGTILDLKRQLPGLLPPHALSDAEKAQLKGQMKPIVAREAFAVASVSAQIDGIRTALEAMAKVATPDPARPPALPVAAMAIGSLQQGFDGPDGVVERLRGLLPVVDNIRAQFKDIPVTIDDVKQIAKMPDEPAILPVIKERAARRVLGEIYKAKQILVGIERDLRPRLREQLINLQANLAATPAGEKQAAVDDLKGKTDALLKAADDLYIELFNDVRVVERGIASILQPANLRMRVREFQDQVRRIDPEEAVTVDAIQVDPKSRLYRVPFFGETDAEYEIVIGLSHIPPFQIPSRQPEFAGQELVSVQLLGENGGESAFGDQLRLDAEASTPTMRVYRLPKSRERPSQRFQLKVIENKPYADTLLKDTVRYTISIASLRPNVQLNAGIVYETLRPADAAQPKKLDEDDAADKLPPLTTIRGTFSWLLPAPVVEVSVYGGTPILGAQVKGIYQVLGKSNDLRSFPTIDFHDDGVTPDRARNDGIYTAQIPLDKTPPGGAAFRLGIQAFATDKQPTQNIPFEPSDEKSANQSEDNAKANKKSDEGEPQSTKPLLFERATSVHFQVQR